MSDMPKYLTSNGDVTTADDPNRMIWYATHCGYWTDEWDRLSKTGGIPCCPGTSETL